MPSKSKIKIIDASELRNQIDNLADNSDQITLSKWAIIIAKNILHYLDNEYPNSEEVNNGFNIQEQRQQELVRMYDVRQAGFKIHELARKCKADTAKYAARTAGQAVGVGHMREHAMVCSDYAIKTINCDSTKGINEVIAERKFQLEELSKLHE